MATKKTTSPAKKSAARPAKQTSAKTAESASTKSSVSSTAGSRSRKGTDAPGSAKRSASGQGGKLSGTAVASRAAAQLLELTGRAVEGVTGLEKTDDGWRVQVEVVEVRRIPDTTDLLALYEIDVDSGGDLVGYRRLRRYVRGVPGEE